MASDTNSFETLFDLIGVLARRRYQLGERLFLPLGLNHTEARMLTLLHHDGGAAAQDALAGRISVDRSNAGRALKRLEDEGYVVRAKDAGDKRANTVRITAKGQKVVAEIHKGRKKMVQEFFGALTEKQAAAAVELLSKAVPAESRGE